jgi:hypothetical protein
MDKNFEERRKRMKRDKLRLTKIVLFRYKMI